MILTADKKFYIPNEDKCGWRWGVGYEFKPFLSTMKQINKKNVALDIGAHVGIWTRRLAVDFNEVISFEPMKKHIECHKKNCEEFDNITLVEVAVSNENRFQVMTTKDINSGMSTLLDQN